VLYGQVHTSKAKDFQRRNWMILEINMARARGGKWRVARGEEVNSEQ
jgi:hypothetical protein